MRSNWVVRSGERRTNVEVRQVGDRYEVTVDGKTHLVDARRVGGTAVRSLLIDGRSYETNTVAEGDRVDVYLNGDLFPIEIWDELWARVNEGKKAGSAKGETITAPIPGAVVKLLVERGQVVTAGQPLCILEAMKMQNELLATWGGKVVDIKTRVGDTVAAGQTLLVITPPEAAAPPA